MTWSRKFDDPIPGIKTLRDAANYINNLPASEQMKPHWQTAVACLIEAAEGRGPLMHARIGMLRAMNHGKVEPRRKRSRVYKII